MNQGKYIFAQLVDFLPKAQFDYIVKKYNANKGIRSLFILAIVAGAMMVSCNPDDDDNNNNGGENGYRNWLSLHYAGSIGGYWSSTPYDYYNDYEAYSLGFDYGSEFVDNLLRNYGQSVRPVTE